MSQYITNFLPTNQKLKFKSSLHKKIMFWPENTLSEWKKALQNGQVAAAPAEGVYGYCANPFNPQALVNLLEIKQRNLQKGFILLISHLNQLTALCQDIDMANEKHITQAVVTHWPGPVTLILPARAELPEALTGGQNTLAIRLPSEPYMIEYINYFGGPLVSTSLNLSGQPPATQASQIPPEIPALTLSQPLSGQPSRIFNPLTNQWLR